MNRFRNPDVAERCEKCGEDIYIGEKFILTTTGRAVCVHCAEETPLAELLEMVGVPFEEAV